MGAVRQTARHYQAAKPPWHEAANVTDHLLSEFREAGLLGVNAVRSREPPVRNVSLARRSANRQSNHARPNPPRQATFSDFSPRFRGTEERLFRGGRLAADESGRADGLDARSRGKVRGPLSSSGVKGLHRSRREAKMAGSKRGGFAARVPVSSRAANGRAPPNLLESNRCFASPRVPSPASVRSPWSV